MNGSRDRRRKADIGLSVEDQHVELLAETMCNAYWQDVTPVTAGRAWQALPVTVRGNWRRAARATLRTINGNRHWLDAGS